MAGPGEKLLASEDDWYHRPWTGHPDDPTPPEELRYPQARRRAELEYHAASTEGNRDRWLDASEDWVTPAEIPGDPEWSRARGSMVPLHGGDYFPAQGETLMWSEYPHDPRGQTALENLQETFVNLDAKGDERTEEETDLLLLLADFFAKRTGT